MKVQIGMSSWRIILNFICGNLRKGRENLNSIVAPNVKEIIKDKCLKQSAVAKKAGYSEQQFCSMMNGRKIIKDIDILRISTALSVDVNELFKKGDE